MRNFLIHAYLLLGLYGLFLFGVMVHAPGQSWLFHAVGVGLLAGFVLRKIEARVAPMPMRPRSYQGHR